MSFIYPGFLFALLALSIPIVVHLFNFKRFKKVYFSDVRFLKDIELQTRQRNQLKHLLVLLFRLLAIAFLVMAFAQPVIPTGNGVFNPNQRKVSVYLDNSFSMDSEGENGDLLENGKQIASEVAKAYSNAGEIRFFTNEMDAAQGRGMTTSEFDEEVSKTGFSSYVREFSQVIKRVGDRSEEDGQLNDIYLISDLQKVSSDLENIASDSSDQINIIPLQANNEGNLYIDSLWFESPVRQWEQPDLLNVRVRNSGDQRKADVPVRLMVDGAQRSLANVSVEPNSYELVQLGFRTTKRGFHVGELVITDHPISYDDNYYFSYRLASNIRVLSIDGENATNTLANLFSNDPDFTFNTMESDRIDHSAFPTYDLIVLNGVKSLNSGLIQEVLSVMNNGSSVLLIPTLDAKPEDYNELLLATSGAQFTGVDTSATKVGSLNLESEIFKNVFMEWKGRIDLPMVNSHFSLSIPTRSDASVLMRLEGGDPLLISSSKAKGSMYVLTSSLEAEASQLAQHAIVVPTLYNLALNSQPSSAPYQVLGNEDQIDLYGDVEKSDVLELKALNSNVSIIPEVLRTSNGLKLNTYGQITEAGQYMVMNGLDTLQMVSYNFNRIESDVSSYTVEEIETQIADLGLSNVQLVDGASANLSSTIKEMHEGKRLWKLFLILALACLAIEILLLRIL
ncbi:MAG: hypothetical protein ACI85F_001042 [Bacteroidia bacterium]|jgi:hypothetical protein